MTIESFGRIQVTVDEDLADLIPGFLENRRNDLSKIENALEKSDFEDIQRLAHDMKGLGGGYGFDAITDIGAALETAAKRKDGIEIQKQLNNLLSYLDRIDIVYQ